jgi:hypothetical protein
MPLYFLLLDGEFFHQHLRPALTYSWQRRSFQPCQALCAELVPAALAFQKRYHIGPEEMLVNRVAEGLPFDRALWRHLAGELLWLVAAEIPEIQTTPEALGCLLGADPNMASGLQRRQLAPIQQAYFGTRDLRFGSGYYRPAEAGYNDRDDVIRLGDYLACLEPENWQADALAALPELADAQERTEELELAKEWLPALHALYCRAQQKGQIIVCEKVYCPTTALA